MIFIHLYSLHPSTQPLLLCITKEIIIYVSCMIKFIKINLQIFWSICGYSFIIPFIFSIVWLLWVQKLDWTIATYAKKRWKRHAKKRNFIFIIFIAFLCSRCDDVMCVSMKSKRKGKRKTEKVANRIFASLESLNGYRRKMTCQVFSFVEYFCC